MSVLGILSFEKQNNHTSGNQGLFNTKILVVDGEPLICQPYSELLTATGFDVETVKDGSCARGKLSNPKSIVW